MAATSALATIDDLIAVAAQRLIPQALQRLSVAEILGDQTAHRATVVYPSKEDLGVTGELESAYNRLIKFLRLHEPTGHEADVAQKRGVVRFLCLKEMLHECRHAKLPHVQAVCLQKVIDWFDETSTVTGSASAPVLPPRMSPKKSSAAQQSGLIKSTSQDPLPNGSVDIMVKDAVAQKLEKYKMPDLRGSHIRRVAQLKSRGVDVSDEDRALADPYGDDDDNNLLGDVLEPADYDARERRAIIKATFKYYEPETDAEYVLNQMWLERKQDEEREQQKEREVRGKLHSWSMSRSRDESEYLRKREAMQLAAGLEKLVEGELEVLNQPQRRHLENKKQEWQALQRAVPQGIAAGTAQPQAAGSAQPIADQKGNLNQDEGILTPARSAMSGSQSTKKKKSGIFAGSGGGMHFRNQLPANYTPQSKRSNGTPTSFSSNGSSTPSTPLSESSSGKLMMLDEAAARPEGRTLVYAKLSEAPLGSDESPAVDEEDDNRRVEHSYELQLRLSERVQENRRHLKFKPFHSSNVTNPRALSPQRAVSTAAISRKLYPRGTIPPQAEPQDPEYRYLYSATMSRKPPMPASILAGKPVGGHTKAGSMNNTKPPGTNQVEISSSIARSLPNSAPARRVVTSSGGSTLSNNPSGQLMSDFRVEQTQEIERIRILFERHNLSFSAGDIERGLLVPEDRSALECVQNLPLPGSQLPSNPLLQIKVKGKTIKKKKKKKGSKSGTKKPKSKTSAGDRSKSPTKTRRK